MMQETPHTTTAASAGRAADSLRSGQGARPRQAQVERHIPTRHADSLRVESADTLETAAVAPDSLARQAEALQFALPYPVYCTADSLRTRFTAHPYREVSAEEVFGTASTVVRPHHTGPAPAQSLTTNPVFQGFVLLLAATYAILLYRHLGDIGILLNRISRDKVARERITADNGSSITRFLNITTAIGMLFIGIVAVKYGDSLMPGNLLGALSQGAVLVMSLLATAAFALIVSYQALMIRGAGALTLSQPFTAQLILLKRTYFSLGVIVTSPPLLLFALTPRDSGGVWFYVIIIELIITSVLYLRETLNLFIAKKVSILHWFLYLCTVELFPFSLLWLIAQR